MRTRKQFNRDTYLLNLIKEVCLFTIMAYGFSNQFMMDHFGPMIPMVAVIFMFIPRVIINETLDKDAEGSGNEN